MKLAAFSRHNTLCTPNRTPNRTHHRDRILHYRTRSARAQTWIVWIAQTGSWAWIGGEEMGCIFASVAIAVAVAVAVAVAIAVAAAIVPVAAVGQHA